MEAISGGDRPPLGKGNYLKYGSWQVEQISKVKDSGQRKERQQNL
jgi:hypothetical protein